MGATQNVVVDWHRGLREPIDGLFHFIEDATNRDRQFCSAV